MDVFGYLDPGSGSMLLQMLLGGIAGVAVSIKLFGKRIFRALAFWRKDEESPATAPDDADRGEERARVVP